ncbi:Fc.00g095440.m01.CDS01 [Cosmosporella sp. VM-42]
MAISKNIILVALVRLFDVSLGAPQSCQSNTWQKLAPLPFVCQDHSTAAINDTTIAVVGGIVGISFTTTDLVQFYDIPSNTWRTMDPTPYKVNYPNVAVVKNKLYLLGGLVDGPAIAGLINHGYGFQHYIRPTEKAPSCRCQIGEGRQQGVGGVVGDTFYVIGGCWFGQSGVRGTVFKLNLNDQASGWQTSPILMPVSRGGLSGDVVGNKYYTFGGEGNPNTLSGVFNQSEAFDFTTGKWTELAPMAVPRHGTHAAAAGNKIYIPGGGLQQGGKAVVSGGVTTYANPTTYFDAYCVE